MIVEDLMGSLISHESRMSKYDESSLENAFKMQAFVSRGRGRRGRRGRGRGNRPNFQNEQKIEAEAKSEKKNQHNPHSFKGSSSRNWQQNAQMFDKLKIPILLLQKILSLCKSMQEKAS